MRYFPLILFCFLTIASAMAQVNEEPIRINYVAKETSLEQLFVDLEKEYGVRFSYATESIENKEINVNFKNESIDEVMDYLLADEKMEYKIVADNILIRKKSDYESEKNVSYKKSLHIRGKIVGGNEQEEALPFATIFINNSSIGTYTDEEGNFDLEIPANYKNENLTIRYLGYKEVSYKIQELEEEILFISLENDPFSVDEVIVVNRQKPVRIDKLKNSMGFVSSQLDVHTSGLAGADLTRQIQLLPGVAAFDDASADIKIRGCQSGETLMILDGMSIYNASHYYGIFSSMNSAFIDTVNVYKNVFPLEFSGKTGGIVELLSSKKQVEKVKLDAEVNFLTASAIAKIPVSRKSMLTVAGRSTIKDVSNTQFNTVAPTALPDSIEQSLQDPIAGQRTNPNFNFWDINAKFQSQLSKTDFLNVNFFKSEDYFTNTYKRKINDKNKKDAINLDASEDETWSNLAGSIVYNKQFLNRLKISSRLSFTEYKNDADISYKIDQKEDGRNTPQLKLNAKQANHLMDIDADLHADLRIGENAFQVGIAAIRHDIKYNFDENDQKQIRDDDVVNEASTYMGYSLSLRQKFHLNTGLRATYYDKLEEVFFSPRISVNFDLTKNIFLKSGYSYYQQFIRGFQHEYRGETKSLWINAGSKFDDTKIPVLESQNFMLGGVVVFKGLSLDVEFYHKEMEGLIEYTVSNPGSRSSSNDRGREYKTFIGDGYSQGVDFLLSTGYKKYNSYLVYTLSKTEQRYGKINDGDYFPTEDDRRHQLKWINSYKVGDFLFGANFIYASGKPYTDIEQLREDCNIEEVDSEKRFRYLPDYKRLDLCVLYETSLFGINSKFTFSIFNVLNNQNIKYIQNINSIGQQDGKPIYNVIGSESSLLNRTYNISIRIGI